MVGGIFEDTTCKYKVLCDQPAPLPVCTIQYVNSKPDKAYSRLPSPLVTPPVGSVIGVGMNCLIHMSHTFVNTLHPERQMYMPAENSVFCDFTGP